MAGLKIESVGIAPNPVDAGNQIKISVGVSSGRHFAFVGDYVGAFMNTSRLIHRPLAYVNDTTKKKE